MKPGFYELSPSTQDSITQLMTPCEYKDMGDLMSALYQKTIRGIECGETKRDELVVCGLIKPNKKEFCNTDYSGIFIDTTYQKMGRETGDMAVEFAQSVHNAAVKILPDEKKDKLIAAENSLLLLMMRYIALGVELDIPAVIETFNSVQVPAKGALI